MIADYAKSAVFTSPEGEHHSTRQRRGDGGVFTGGWKPDGWQPPTGAPKSEAEFFIDAEQHFADGAVYAFREGAAAAGIPSTVTAADLHTREFVARQMKSFVDFCDDVTDEDSGYTLASETTNRRAQMYAKSMEMCYWHGWASALPPDALIIWNRGATTDSCLDCVRMAGRGPIPVTEFLAEGLFPQSFDLACHGFNCDCFLTVAAPDALTDADEHWVTMNGRHVLINAEGEMVNPPAGMAHAKSSVKPGDPHPTKPHLAPSTAEQRNVIKDRGHDAIPPSSWGLEVSSDPSAKVQAKFHDAKGRVQYRYHSDHIKAAAAEKYRSAETTFANHLPELRERVSQDLASVGPSAKKSTAAILRIMDHTAMRVGSEKFVGENGTYGAASLRKQHVALGENGRIDINFRGKHGIEHSKTVNDSELHSALTELHSVPGDKLFQASAGKPVTESNVSKYLKSVHADLHAHQFRTHQATEMARSLLKTGERSENPKDRQKAVNEMLGRVSGHLGNTPTQARDNYINPEVIAKYHEGTL
jgi:DNA topoisomerase-1